MGRGWCAWGCFYGGMDEGFSKILRKPLVSTRRTPPYLRLFPQALIPIIVVWSFLALEKRAYLKRFAVDRGGRS